MKRCLLLICIMMLCLFLNACSKDFNVTDTLPEESFIPRQISVVENTGNNIASYVEPMDSFEALCRWSNTIVKAKYIDNEVFTENSKVFRFELEHDYIGNVDESIIYLYDSDTTSFITGKSYYLFLYGTRLATYPHIKYSRTDIESIIGEEVKEGITTYTICVNNTVTKLEENLPQTIIELVSQKKYRVDNLTYRDETYKDAYENADAILLVTITNKPHEPVNRYVQDCEYKIDECLKGEYHTREVDTSALSEEAKIAAGIKDGLVIQPTTMCWPEIEIGTQLVMLFEYIEEKDYYKPYYGPNEKFYADSEAGRYIIQMSIRN